MNEKFEFTEQNSKLLAIRHNLRSLAENDSLLHENWQKLEDTLTSKDADSTLKVAVCGQYSAGKSTLVHALTSDDTIAIGQDVTTDKVSTYDWNGIKIADTPGIYAGRQEHDDLSLEYIKEADLLIYMITIQGFTREIGANFKKLVLEKYADKTMLLMNKRNQEPAENEKNWIHDTTEFLGGSQMLNKLYFSIVDIEDYLIGIKENEPELIAESKFGAFLERLNAFIKDRELTGKITSRVNIIDAFLDLYIDAFSQAPKGDEFTQRQRTALQNAIKNCRKACTASAQRIKQGIQAQKAKLLGLLADETLQEFKLEVESTEYKLQELFADKQLIADLEIILDELRNDLERIAVDCDRYELHLKELAARYQGMGGNVNGSVDLSMLKMGMGGIEKFLKTIDAHGLKKFVHFFGGKFKPWGATKWAKFLSGTLSTAFKWLGTAMTVAQFFMDQKHKQEMEQQRSELNRTFNEMEAGVEDMLKETMESDDGIIYAMRQMLADIESYEQEQIALREHKATLLQKLTTVKEQLNNI